MVETDDRGAAVLVGFALLLAVSVLALGVFQATVVPSETRSAEADHNRAVQSEMVALGAAVDRSARSGVDRGVAVRLAPDYPSRRFLLSPPSAAGTLETTPGEARLENVAVVGDADADDYRRSDATFETGHVVYRPSYLEYDSGATVRYEHGIVGADQVSGDDRLRGSPTLVDGDAIRLTALHGEFSRSASSMAVEARSASAARPVRVAGRNGQPIRLTLTTDLSASAWGAALADEPATVVSPPGDDNRVTIELDPDEEPYDLYLGAASLNERRDPDPAYLTNVTGKTPAADERFTVEVRDRYDNPVADAALNVTGCGLADTRTDDEGRASFRCGEPGSSVTVRLDDPDRGTLAAYETYEWVRFDVAAVTASDPFVEPDLLEVTERRFRTDAGSRDRVRLRVDYSALGDAHGGGVDLESAAIAIYERDTAFPVDGSGRPVTATTQPLSGPEDGGTWVTPWLDPGDYAATIRVTNVEGGTRTAYANERTTYSSLSADAGPDREVAVGESIRFDGSGSTGNVDTYEWDFGDGTTASGVSPEHDYSSPGTYTVTLTVTAPDGETATNTAQVRVVDPVGTISGVVTEQGTTSPLQGVDISVRDADGVEVATATTDADGTYRVSVSGDATYTVVADGTDIGFSTESAAVPVPQGGAATQDFQLSPLDGSVSGTVRDPNGNPLSGVAIEVRDPSTGVVVGTATTGSNGGYTVGVEGGTSYDVVADGSGIGYSVVTATRVRVPSGGSARQDFELAPLDGSISGTVRSQAGDALSGVAIEVRDAATGTVVATATTDAEGRYSVTVGGDRRYDVTADGSSLGFSTAHRTDVYVGPGEAVTGVDFTLTPRDGTISGRVVNEGGVPIQGVTMRITDPATGGVIATRTTDSEGRYSVTVAGDRSYDVQADGSAVYYETKTRRVTVPPGGSVTADFQLNPTGRAAPVVFVTGSQTSFGNANAQYGFALRNEGDVSATIRRVAIPRVDGRSPASAIGRDQQSPNNVFRPTFTVVDAAGTATPGQGSIAGTERLIVGGGKLDMTTPAAIGGGQTVRFTVGEFKTTTTGFQRANMVGASVVLSVTFEDGSQRTIVVSP